MAGQPSIGLVLSGGSVRGAAHIGVLDVLEREGIRPHCVAGASAGAMAGAVFCAGVPVEDMQRLVLEMRWRQVGRLVRPRLGFFDSSRLETRLLEIIGPCTFDQLSIPLAVVAADLMREEVVVIREGPVAHAVRASCALPGIFTPVEWEGRLLVDGGVLNNLPVSVARDMGAEYVIAVDLLPSTQLDRPPKNLLEMWYRTFYTLLRALHREAGQADCLISPQLGPFDFVDFSRVPDLIQRGREAAEAHVAQIKADLRQRELACSDTPRQD
jgi:NTE family protein